MDHSEFPRHRENGTLGANTRVNLRPMKDAANQPSRRYLEYDTVNGSRLKQSIYTYMPAGA